MLLKSLKVFGVGCRRDISIVFDMMCVNCCKFFMIWNVVELLSFVEILFMNIV